MNLKTYDIDYDRNNNQLEAFFVFAVCVANKKADTTIIKVNSFLNSNNSPFDLIRNLIKEGRLKEELQKARTGQYTRIERALTYIVNTNLNLRTCSVEELLKVPGIGNKTARFFIAFSRPNQRLAILDTHILKFLRAKGYDAPKSTPTSNKEYKKLEEAFLKEADKLGRNPTELDYELWQYYAYYGGKNDKYFRNGGKE